MQTYSTMCSFPRCKRKTFVAGYCYVCQSKYCKQHRLPEKHNCSGLNQYKEQLRSQHRATLKDHQCINSKIDDFYSQ